jgi:hypothetical protein
LDFPCFNLFYQDVEVKPEKCRPGEGYLIVGILKSLEAIQDGGD